MKIIDVSTFQGAINWEKAKPNIAGAMLRAGYGQNNIDAQFVRNISECNRLGIPCGVYWFSYAYNAAMATKEAEYCLEAVKDYKLELPIAYDWEYDSVNYCKRHGVNPSPVLANKLAEAFCRKIEESKYYAILYTNGDFLSKYFTDVARYDIWYAAWPNNPDPAKPPRRCGMWQYGGTYVDGITGLVDTNEAYRDYPTLIRNAGLNHLKTEPTEQDLIKAWAEENGMTYGDAPLTRNEVITWLYRMR